MSIKFYKMFFKILILSFICLTQFNPVFGECGYELCKETDPKKLNIHVVAHSHDDVGYMKTVDGYYFEDVQHIITNVVNSLKVNPKRIFTEVEVYFFNRWWSEQNNQTHELVQELVKSGQLSFANGGYTVNDEGAAHYNEIIDQMTVGLNILDKIFGKCGHPLISWQIDPFGASKEMASLYAQMGFDGHVFNRGVFPKGEFIWRGSQDLGKSSDIFTTILHDHYGPPNGLDFEFGNDVTVENRKQKAELLVNVAKKWNQDFDNTNQVLVPFGQDFRFRFAEHYFTNLDKLIDAVHEYHPDVNMFYSNPMCYLWSVNQMNHTFSYRERDYFPLWSGFFTSRPSLKRQERTTNNLLQIVKQLDAMIRLPESEPFLSEAKNEIAIMTHHDAITGTSAQTTIDDYIRRLFSASAALQEVVNRSYSIPQSEESNYSVPKQIFCDRLNISECYVTENNPDFSLMIYNPIPRRVSEWLRIPIPDYNYEVYYSNGTQIKEVHKIPISESVLKIPGRQSSAKHELVFETNLTALGWDTFFVKKVNKSLSNIKSDETLVNHMTGQNSDQTIQMKGKGFTLNLNNRTGNIESIKLDNGNQYALKETFKFYKSNHDSSYTFCAEGEVNNIDSNEVKLEAIYSKGLVHEVQQRWNQWITQTIRVYENREYIELDWIVEHIPIDDNIGKEVIIRFETDFNTNGVFYTDANGRQNVKRTRTSRKEECGTSNNSVSLNYYPIYSKAFIRDEQKGIQLTVLNDRTQGGSSLSDGQLELMIHRRLLTEPKKSINETGPDGKGLEIRGKHYIFFKPIEESVKLYRDLSLRIFMSPMVTFSPLTESLDEYLKKYKYYSSGLRRELPENVNLLTLEKWKQNKVLIRFEHFYESIDKTVLSKAVEIDLQNLFTEFNIQSIREMTLSANQLLSESNRLKWKTNTSLPEDMGKTASNETDMKIVLSPQQIRTFILTIEDKNFKNKFRNCSLEWKLISGDKIPTDAIIGGFDIDSKPLYICRHKENGDLIPGKANEKLGCVVTIGGKPFTTKTNYEILFGQNYDWVQRHGGDAVPQKAFIGGHDSQGMPIYVGKCDKHIGTVEIQVVGKIKQKFYYVLGDKELDDCDDHQIMVC